MARSGCGCGCWVHCQPGRFWRWVLPPCFTGACLVDWRVRRLGGCWRPPFGRICGGRRRRGVPAGLPNHPLALLPLHGPTTTQTSPARPPAAAAAFWTASWPACPARRRSAPSPRWSSWWVLGCWGERQLGGAGEAGCSVWLCPAADNALQHTNICLCLLLFK